MALPRAFQATRIGHRSQMKCLSISLQLYFEDSLFAIHPDALPDEVMRLWGLTKKQVFGELTGGYTVTGGRKEIMERGHRFAPLQGLSFRVSDPHSGTVLLSGHLAMSGVTLDDSEGAAIGIECSKTSDAVKHPIICRTGLYSK